MKKMIKAVLFDYGGVISMYPDPPSVHEMCRLAGLPAERFKINYKKYRNDYDLNKLSAGEYWRKVLNGSSKQFSRETIKNLIGLDVESWTVVNKDMLQFICELSKKNVKKAIISNMTIETLYYMKKHFRWLELFDHLVFSCELKSSKPAAAIFQRCLELLDLEPRLCVFIDDSPENIKGAERLGLNTIHYRNYEQFSKGMERTYELI